MSQVTEQVNFDDKVVIVPVELARDRELDGDCLAVFMVMKSFGPRAEAKVETLAARLDWPVARVKRAQARLLQARWIILLREGACVSKSQGIYKPRLWWCCRVKGESAPQGAEVGGTKIGTPTNRDPHQKGSPSVGDPKNGGAEAVEGSSSSRRTIKRECERESQNNSANSKAKNSLSLSASPKDPQEILARLSVQYAKKHGHALTPTSTNLMDAAELDRLFGPDLEATFQRYLSDPGRTVPGQRECWLDLNRHPLGVLRSQPDSYRTSTQAPNDQTKKAKAEQQAKSEAERDAKAEADRRQHRRMSELWPTLTKGQREAFLTKASELSPFSHRLVQEHRKKHGLEGMPVGSLVAVTVLELWPGFPALPEWCRA